jgi:hypothetical protein
LKSISIPTPVKEIDDAAFKYCAELESSAIPEDSQLGRIGNESFSGCQSLISFCIPRDVTIVGEKCFAVCKGLELGVIAENSNMSRIRGEAFSECRVLRSFYIPESIAEIGDDCFRKYCSLDRLVFGSGEPFKTFVIDSTLDDALEKFGLDQISTFFGIEINDVGVHFEFPGWSAVTDEILHLTLIQEIR